MLLELSPVELNEVKPIVLQGTTKRRWPTKQWTKEKVSKTPLLNSEQSLNIKY